MINLSLIKNCKVVNEVVGALPDKKNVELKTHSGLVEKDDLFVFIKGENFDAIKFLDDVVKKGATVIVVNDTEENRGKVVSYKDVTKVFVRDTVSFIQEVATLHIASWKKNGQKHIFAICGSNGKTTHKEMLAHSLEQLLPGKFVITQKNDNNHLGVPFTLLRAKPEHELVVVELGSNHPGEIPLLCGISQPDSGIVTNIGQTHLEFFDNLENVFKEEGFLYHYLKDAEDKFFFIINNDDTFLTKFEDHSWTTRVGEGEGSDVPYTIEANRVSLKQDNVKTLLTNDNIFGRHNFQNLANCFVILKNLLSCNEKQISFALSSFCPQNMRSQWVECRNKKIFLDAYNANPSSMKVALEAFKDYLESNEKKTSDALIVLGDMKELGKAEAKYHYELGKFLNSLGFREVMFVGEMAEKYREGFGEKSEVFQNVSLAKESFFKNSAPYVFLKGSRSLQLEQLIDIN